MQQLHALLAASNGERLSRERRARARSLLLQIETEQIDAATLSRLPVARLRHYNQVLAEQAAALESEVHERAPCFRIEFDRTARDVSPKCVDQALTVRIVQARACLGTDQVIRQTRRSAAAARGSRRAAGSGCGRPDFEDLALLAALFEKPLRAPRAATRRPKRRGTVRDKKRKAHP